MANTLLLIYTHTQSQEIPSTYRESFALVGGRWEAFMGRYEGGSLFLEKHWYLLIKFYSTLQSAASYGLWANCGVCVRACVRLRVEVGRDLSVHD